MPPWNSKEPIMDTAPHSGSPAAAAPDPDKVLTGEDAEQVFRLILERPAGDAAYLRSIADRAINADHYARELIGSQEFRRNYLNRIGYPEERGGLDDPRYRVPTALSRPSERRMRILLVGSCMMDDWPDIMAESAAGQGIELSAERLPFNNASPLPPLTAEEAAGFDFAILQIPCAACCRRRPSSACAPMTSRDIRPCSGRPASSCASTSIRRCCTIAPMACAAT
jgi:hypothetical protein